MLSRTEGGSADLVGFKGFSDGFSDVAAEFDIALVRTEGDVDRVGRLVHSPFDRAPGVLVNAIMVATSPTFPSFPTCPIARALAQVITVNDGSHLLVNRYVLLFSTAPTSRNDAGQVRQITSG